MISIIALMIIAIVLVSCFIKEADTDVIIAGITVLGSSIIGIFGYVVKHILSSELKEGKK